MRVPYFFSESVAVDRVVIASMVKVYSRPRAKVSENVYAHMNEELFFFYAMLFALYSQSVKYIFFILCLEWNAR